MNSTPHVRQYDCLMPMEKKARGAQHTLLNLKEKMANGGLIIFQQIVSWKSSWKMHLMSEYYLKMKAHLFPILTLRELTNRQKYLQNRQMLSGRKEQHILFMDKNNGSETLHASMCFGNKNAESFWDQDIPAGGSSKKVWTANEFGKFYINFTSNPHGLNLDGTVSVRVSSNKSDLS